MKYGYARVSTYGQAKDGNSLQDQTAKLVEAGVSPENIYKDAFTGTKIDRPEFDKVLALLQPGDELVVTKLDRFARSAWRGAMVAEGLHDRGITLNILNLGRVDSTSMGTFMLNILFAFAQFERDMIVERTSAGKAYAREHKAGYKEGRPKIDDGIFEIAAKTKKDGQMTVKQICEQFGFSRSAWYAWQKGREATLSGKENSVAPQLV